MPEAEESQNVTRAELEKGDLQVETGKAYHFVVENPTRLIRVLAEDENGQALAGRKFTLKAGGQTFEGTTTDAGLVELKIPSDATEASLEVDADDGGKEKHEWTLKLGKLPPADTAAGVRERLKNLGYGSDNLQLDLRQFQEDHDLPATGASDGATVQKLVELAGS